MNMMKVTVFLIVLGCYKPWISSQSSGKGSSDHIPADHLFSFMSGGGSEDRSQDLLDECPAPDQCWVKFSIGW